MARLQLCAGALSWLTKVALSPSATQGSFGENFIPVIVIVPQNGSSVRFEVFVRLDVLVAINGTKQINELVDLLFAT
jgi:hypothetical protein